MNYPLSDDQLHRFAPSIFAEEPHDSRSSRYQFIPTIRIVNALRDEGFEPFAAQQTIVRDKSRVSHSKHLIRMRHNSIQGDLDDTNEIVLINSHDGSSSYRIMAGCYRFVCANGLILGDAFDDVRIRHQGEETAGLVIEGAYEVLSTFDQVNEHKEGMKSLKLTDRGAEVFAEAALSLKYDPKGGPAPVTPSQLLFPRHREDCSNTVWHIFNRIQESLISGGLRGRSRNGRRTRTRAVNGIDQNVQLNSALWSLAEAFRSGNIFE